MEAVLKIAGPKVAASASLDEAGVLVSLYLGDELEPRSEAVINFPELVDELAEICDLEDDADRVFLLKIAKGLQETAKDILDMLDEVES